MTNKRTQTVHEPERTVLISSKDAFKQDLSKRLEIGEELLSRQVSQIPDLDKLKTDFYDWDDYNSELLKNSFNNPTNEYKSEYDNSTEFLGLMDLAAGRYNPNEPSYVLKDN
jgi:hypothetical protein